MQETQKNLSKLKILVYFFKSTLLVISTDDVLVITTWGAQDNVLLIS